MKGVLDLYREELDKGIYEGLRFILRNKEEIFKYYPKSVLPELTLNTYIYHHWHSRHASVFIEEQLEKILERGVQHKSDIQIFKNFIDSLEETPEHFKGYGYSELTINKIKGELDGNN